MTHPTRRGFLAATASAMAVGGLARADDPKEAPRGANDAIGLGFIGVGGMGRGLLDIFKGFPDVRVVAVCDVWDRHAGQAKDAAGGKPSMHRDFREVLDNKDVDAVVIATPDHWHAIPAILACQAGKDVYCEKPLSHRVLEGRRMVEAAHKYKRVTQMGNLIHATENYHRVVEIVQSGVLGTISKARVWMAADRRGLGSPPDGDPPSDCDYNFWLGPAPKRPFNPNRFTFNWRYFWDYGGGILTDFCCHIVDPVHWAMRVEAPETICATGGRYALKDNAETPDTLEVAYHYKTPDGQPFDMIWSQSDASAYGFEGLGLGIMFQGTEATLVANYGMFKIHSGSKQPIELPPPSLPRSVGHHREWLNAIRSREQCSCNWDYGHRLASVGNLGNIALATGAKLHWDGDKERFTNHDEANQYLAQEEYRDPWKLPEV